MALKLNDPPELTTPAKSDSAPVNPGSAPAQSSRSNPVCLEVPVTVRRVASGEQSGASALAQPAPEEGRTVIVFENGAVLRLASSLPAGTAVSLTNSRGHEVVCRVASTRNLPSIKGYVEVKFEEAANDFWGLQHGGPPARTSVPEVPATIVAPPAATAPAMTTGVPSPRPVAVPPPPPPPLEKLQRNAPPLEGIAGQVPISPPLGGARKLREPEPRLPAPGNRVETARNVSQPLRIGASGNKTETIGFADEVGPTSAPRSGAIVSGLRPTAASSREIFGGAKLVSVPGPTPSVANGSHGKMLWVLGVLAGGLALACVTLFIVRRSNLASPVPPPPPVAQLSAPTPPESMGTDVVQPSDTPQDVSVVPASPAATTSPVVSEQAVPVAVTSVPEGVRRAVENADAKQPERSVAPKRTISNFNLSAPAGVRANASRLPDGSSPGAGDLIASGPASAVPLGGMLPSDARTGNQPAPPPPAFDSSESSTGPSREAKQISVTRPVYPEIAKTARVQGTVVVSAEVDEKGKVTGAKAVSGPMQLRQAAIDAVRQWKYEPALANGRPTATRVTVDIAFHLQ